MTLPKHGEVMDIAARLMMLLLGILGWASNVVLGGYSLHCGGTQLRDQRATERYQWMAYVGLMSIVVLCVALFKAWLWLYFPVIMVFICALVGEVGWGEPSMLFVLFFR